MDNGNEQLSFEQMVVHVWCQLLEKNTATLKHLYSVVNYYDEEQTQRIVDENGNTMDLISEQELLDILLKFEND